MASLTRTSLLDLSKIALNENEWFQSASHLVCKLYKEVS